MNISFIIPIKNESESLRELVSQIENNVKKIPHITEFEVILVDDGSTDNSWNVIEILTSESPFVKSIRLRRNFGKATALAAGFELASGNYIFTLDADLQDDPNEIPNFLAKMEEGFGLVSGWKKNRLDPLSKTIPSKIFNKITCWLTGIKLHDFNCGYKCYRRDLIKHLSIYGELHRYIPVLAADLGYSIGEVEVIHHPRKYGVTKYGLSRYLGGFLGLLTVLTTTRWLQKPNHLFGSIGIFFGLIGSGILTYLTILWFTNHGPIGSRPLLTFGVLFLIVSIQMISLGILSEFFIRTRTPKSTNIFISEKINFNK